MDRRLFITSATAFAVIGTAARADRMVINSPRDGYLNLRTGPGDTFKVLRQMPHGTKVEVLEVAGAWVRVRHQSGAVGWAYGQYLAALGPSPFYTIYSPGDGYLNLRTGPGTKFSIIGRMYNGQEVRILERAGDWVRVRHESGTKGWCSIKYLRQ